jgi:hypothetical protein
MTCLLAGLLFVLTSATDCAAAEPFARGIVAVNERHTHLVRSVALVPGNVGWAYPDGPIRLPEAAPWCALLHEVGHLVGWTAPRGQQLMTKWSLTFQPAQAPTVYGRSSIYEDFAESYTLAMIGGLHDPARARWLSTELGIDGRPHLSC